MGSTIDGVGRRAARLAAGLDAAGRAGRDLSARHAAVRASAPWNDGDGYGALVAGLEAAMPGFEDRPELLIAGSFEGGDFTASMGRLLGRHWTPFHGRGRTARLAELRYGRFDRWEGAAIVESWLIFDVTPGLIQLGLWTGAPPMGPPVMPAPPLDTAPGDGPASLALVEAMIGGLRRYRGDGDLSAMGMRDHWRDDFNWFGPAAIGSFRGHDDYERGHQAPFLRAFPDRVGGNHKCRIGDGAWVASTGWPSIRATHTGSGWLGLPATGRPVTMRVMDFWRVDGGRLADNWVFVDIPDVLAQLGLDPFARFAEIMEA